MAAVHLSTRAILSAAPLIHKLNSGPTNGDNRDRYASGRWASERRSAPDRVARPRCPPASGSRPRAAPAVAVALRVTYRSGIRPLSGGAGLLVRLLSRRVADRPRGLPLRDRAAAPWERDNALRLQPPDAGVDACGAVEPFAAPPALPGSRRHRGDGSARLGVEGAPPRPHISPPPAPCGAGRGPAKRAPVDPRRARRQSGHGRARRRSPALSDPLLSPRRDGDWAMPDGVLRGV